MRGGRAAVQSESEGTDPDADLLERNPPQCRCVLERMGRCVSRRRRTVLCPAPDCDGTRQQPSGDSTICALSANSWACICEVGCTSRNAIGGLT
jgi:hypothetical protein